MMWLKMELKSLISKLQIGIAYVWINQYKQLTRSLVCISVIALYDFMKLYYTAIALSHSEKKKIFVRELLLLSGQIRRICDTTCFQVISENTGLECNIFML